MRILLCLLWTGSSRSCWSTGIRWTKWREGKTVRIRKTLSPCSLFLMSIFCVTCMQGEPGPRGPSGPPGSRGGPVSGCTPCSNRNYLETCLHPRYDLIWSVPGIKRRPRTNRRCWICWASCKQLTAVTMLDWMIVDIKYHIWFGKFNNKMLSSSNRVLMANLESRERLGRQVRKEMLAHRDPKAWLVLMDLLWVGLFWKISDFRSEVQDDLTH